MMMKRPTKKPKITTENMNVINTYTEYTPEHFRKIANEMEQKNIESIELEVYNEYGDFEIKGEASRMETEKEAKKRYDKEYQDYQKWKQNRKKIEIIEERTLTEKAKKLGMKF